MFKDKKYQVIKQAIPYDLTNFIFNYFLLKQDAVEFMYKNNIIHDNGMVCLVLGQINKFLIHILIMGIWLWKH